MQLEARLLAEEEEELRISKLNCMHEQICLPSGQPDISLEQSSILHKFDDAWVLYFPLTDRLLILNATAKIVWDFLVQGLKAHEIASTFARHFGISDQQAARDVAQVLTDLADEQQASAKAEVEVANIPAATASVRVVDWNNELADCGAFQFGRNRISVLSAVTKLDESFFARFQHRAIDDDDVDLLEISASDSAYRLTFRDRVIAEATTINRTMWHLVEFLLSLEHPHQSLLAYCHAGAVSRRGRSILMPGNSGAGKSTLTGFLVAHGFTYLGDDTIAVGDDEFALLPLPTSLSIKTGSWTLLEPFYPALPKLATVNRYGRSGRYIDPPGNYEVLSAAAAPSAIVFPAFSKGAPTQLTPLRPHQSMIRLLEANIRLSGWDAATEDQLARFVRFVEQTPAYELSYSELPEAMKAIEELLGSQP